MTSRRTWMLGLALGVCITVNNTSEAYAQVPRQISYQGQILSDQQPLNGPQTITINYYSPGSTTPIFSETFNNVDVRDGIFNLMLGSASSGFPASMDFSEQYSIGVAINNSAELTPRTPLLATPYALNAERVNGFSVSQLPAAGSILVLDDNAKVPSSALPDQPNFVAGDNITITRDSLTNTFTFNSTGGTTAGVSSISTGAGLTSTGTSGNVNIAIAPNGITSEMIAVGSITGAKLSPQLAGEGLFQDILGNLNVGVDNTSIRIVNDRLQIGALGSGNFDPNQIQSRVTGTAAAGEFITGINSNGSVTTATIETDSSLLRTLNGTNVFLRLNPAFTNTFTATQNFDAGITTNGIVNNGTLTQNGNVTFGDGLNPTNVMFNTMGGVIDFSGATLQNVGEPINGTDVVTLDFLNTSQTNMTFAGDITGTPGAIEIDPANVGIGDRLITGINAGTTTIANTAIADDLTINGGIIDNTPIGGTTPNTGSFTTLSSSDQTFLATGSGNVMIGSSTPASDAIFQIERSQGTELLARIYNTGAAGSELRLIGGSSATSALSFTDATEYIASVNASSGGGLTLNVRDVGESNDDATLEGAVALRVERDRDVVIGEDLTVNGAVNFGSGDDNITFNSGTGVIDFGGAALTNLGSAVAGTDAVTLDQLNNSMSAQTFSGDITGTPSTIEIDPASAGIGDRLITGINAGTTTIGDAAITDALTINGGTIDATTIGAVAPAVATFSELTTTGETMLASTGGNVVIGTTVDTDIAPLEVVEDVTTGTEGVAAYIRTTTSGGATRSLGLVVESTGDGTADITRPASNAILGVAKYNGAFVTDQQLMGIVGKAEPGTNGIAAIGVVGQATDANTLLNTGVLGIARNGGTLVGNANIGVAGTANASDADVASIGATAPTAGVLAYNNSLDGAALWAMSPTAGVAVEVAGGGVTSTAVASGSTSNRFADTYTVTGGPLTLITIDNSLVTPTSTVIVTFEDNSGGTIPTYRVITSNTGSFQVELSDAAEDGDEIHYMIINH